MRNAVTLLAVVTAVATCASTYAQSSSTVIFKNRNIATPSPNQFLADGVTPNPNYVPGGNNNGSFNIPIYQDAGYSVGAGLLPGGVTVGLFYNENLLGTALLGTTVQGSPFFVTPSLQELQIRDAAGNVPAPGSTPTLVVRAWTTESGGFAAAKSTPGGRFGEWAFTSLPISGAGSPPSTPPDLTAWGAINGYSNRGFTLFIPEPSTIALGALGSGALLLARRRK
jgi:hypothetical protein